MEAPPRPPKKDHMQNRKLSPSSIERIQRRQSLTGENKVPIANKPKVRSFYFAVQRPKGQLILKCPFGVFKSPKKSTKFFPGFLP